VTYYAAVGLTPTSEEWIPGYLSTVTSLVKKHGGKYLARTVNHERLEGDGESPAVMCLIEWPSKEAFESFYSDPDYQPHLQARLAGCKNDIVLVEGKDDFA
jgi:uncharacterized protein (DUF1330 family)